MDVSIIIVNYNTLQMTKQCIDSLFENIKDITFEVILVDNASKDGSKEFFEMDDRVRYLYIDENLGFGRANNRGLEICRGRNILFLNSDTLVVDNTIKLFSDYLDSHKNAGACGGNLFSIEGEPMHSFRRMFPSVIDSIDKLLFNMISRFLYGKSIEHNNTTHTLNVAYITGADLMIKGDLLSGLKGFDDDFFMYYEETELCKRIHNLGHQIVSLPYTHIIHHESKSFASSDGFKRKVRMLNDSKGIYMKKHLNILERLIINILWILTVLSRLVFFGLNKNKRIIWKTYLFDIFYRFS